MPIPWRNFDEPPIAGIVQGEQSVRRRSATRSKEPQEGCKHQDNANIHHQPFPEPISKEEKIHTNDNGYHQQSDKHGRHALCHFHPP
jgi:hypothetical protein